MYKWKGEDVIFGGDQFQTEDSLFDSVSSWMDTFEVPYVLEDPNDKYSDEHEINNPLTDEYEIKNKPEENEYPVVCKLCLNGMPVPLLRNCYSIFNGTKYR